MRKINLISILLTLASVFCSALCGSPERLSATDVKGMPSDVACRLQVNRSGHYLAKVTVLNLSDHIVYLYSVFLPKSGLSLVDMFSVQRGSNRLPYRGAMAKLPGRPSKEDFIALGPHKEASATIPLSDNYDISVPGRYTVRYNIVHPQPGGGMLLVSSNEVSFRQQNIVAK